MTVLTRNELRNLTSIADQPCASIYMPIHMTGAEVRQDPIRLRNLLKLSEQMLISDGMRTPDAQQILAPADTLMLDASLWRRQGEGLAIFAAANHFSWYALPVPFEQLVTVASHFHVKPLIAVLDEGESFYLLSLAQKQVRLYVCSRNSVSELELRATPTSLDEILAVESPEKTMQWHTRTQFHSGERPAMYHSQGGGTDDAVKKRKVRYFIDLLEQGVRKSLNGSESPLVLAGVEYLRAMYRDANSYPHLLAEGIQGNPELLSPEQLRDKAMPIVEPVWDAARRRAADRYMHLTQTEKEKAVSGVDKVVEAAYQGRVDELFIDVQSHRWGRYEPTLNEVAVRTTARPGDEDLLDYATYHTLKHGGKVYAVSGTDLPQDAPALAVLRY